MLYIDVLLRLIESLVLFILTKIRNYEITMQDEELAYRYVKYFRFVALGTFVTAIFLASWQDFSLRFRDGFSMQLPGEM